MNFWTCRSGLLDVTCVGIADAEVLVESFKKILDAVETKTAKHF